MFVRIGIHEEVVQVADDDANDLHDPSSTHDYIEGEQDPWKKGSLESGSEPKTNNNVLVQLTPDIHD